MFLALLNKITDFIAIFQIIKHLNHNIFSSNSRYFKRVLIKRQAYTRIGGWWNRKSENEIDIVAENELSNKATFFEVKRKAANIDIKLLRQKAAAFMRATGVFKGYDISYKGLSMEIICNTH